MYSKEEFKRLWESDEHGGGITNEDCADCAKAWNTCGVWKPKCMPIDKVVYLVCKDAGVCEAEMPPQYEE